MIKKNLLPLAFIFALIPTLQASYQFTRDCELAYQALFSFRFADAKTHLETGKQACPENGYLYYLDNYHDFITTVIDGSDEAFDGYKKSLGERLKKLSVIKEKSPYHKYFLAEIFLQSTLVSGQFNDLVNAGIYFYKSYTLAEKNIEEYPGFILNKKIKGIHELMMSIVPGEYKRFFSFFGFSGIYETGIDYLRAYYEYTLGTPFQVEGVMYMFFAMSQFGKDEQAPHEFLVANQHHQSENIICSISYVLSLKALGFTAKALEVLEERGIYYPDVDMPQLDYLYGSLAFSQLKLDKGHFYFSRFLDNYHSHHFIKHTYKKLAWYYYLKDDLGNYRECVKKIHSEGLALLEHDKLAEYELPEPKCLNKTLIKTRLLYDGGYYQEAMLMLSENASEFKGGPLEYQVEFFYRLARVCHALGKMDKAKKYYKYTVQHGKKLEKYFVPYSAYQLGRIAEEEKELKTAEYFYHKTLQLNKKGYKTSIERKARIALHRLSG